MNDKPTIVMLSGGLDSTAVLYGVLTGQLPASSIIHVHHIHIHNPDRRTECERSSVDTIYQYFSTENFLSYTSSESMIGFSAYNNQFLFDTEVLAFMAGNICRGVSGGCNVMTGLRGVEYEGNGFEQRLASSRRILSILSPESEITMPLYNVPKQEVYDSIPKELAALTWSCRRPLVSNNFAPCGECNPCKDKKNLIFR